ncbi:hypothetical protein SAICODRAFT_201041 [Saitoella complicata NRRL Y-17804]|uniref:uncharacterized protein n=1 Tax=Saitoella complicata (strain BCRC 22490 / CBS 7301 / JCM 7358 / NBRC 10748 / NRRL Y-17804) TaxID=698492 RepID=UPI000867DE52|nr:uncharacterized protein SAICODRAFT_201041 [Saitoella complicata NRRL Y-17804]ODQ54596.1 hypothetical protein SAICODRAFT_201041 [Saitoella complicata NRRL Y-17804]
MLSFARLSARLELSIAYCSRWIDCIQHASTCAWACSSPRLMDLEADQRSTLPSREHSNQTQTLPFNGNPLLDHLHRRRLRERLHQQTSIGIVPYQLPGQAHANGCCQWLNGADTTWTLGRINAVCAWFACDTSQSTRGVSQIPSSSIIVIACFT